MTHTRQNASQILRVKAVVRERDGYCCTKCGMTQDAHLAQHERILDVHRLTPGSLYTVEGCVTICQQCHTSQPKREKGQPDFANGPRKPSMTLVLDPATRARLQSQADRFGLSISEYIRQGVTERLERDEQARR